MEKKWCSLIAAVVLFCSTMAQTGVKQDSSAKYDIHLSATALFSGGNLKRTVTQNRLTASLGNNHVQFVTENSYRYGKNFTRVVENDFLTRNYLRLLPTQKKYAFILGVYETNYRRSIKNRWQLGFGGAVNFYRKAKDFLRFSIAGAYENASYKLSSFNLPKYNGSNKVEAIRALFRVGGQHRILKDHLVLKHDTWLMQDFKNTDNYRWHSLLGLQMTIYGGLAFKTDYEYTYESLAISSSNPFGYPSNTGDWVLSFGLSYDINKGK